MIGPRYQYDTQALPMDITGMRPLKSAAMRPPNNARVELGPAHVLDPAPLPAQVGVELEGRYAAAPRAEPVTGRTARDQADLGLGRNTIRGRSSR